MRFRVLDLRAFGRTVSKADPDGDQRRLAKIVTTELGPALASVVSVERRDGGLGHSRERDLFDAAVERVVDVQAFEPFQYVACADLTDGQHLEVVAHIGPLYEYGAITALTTSITLAAAMRGSVTLRRDGQLDTVDGALRASLEGRGDLRRRVNAVLRTRYTPWGTWQLEHAAPCVVLERDGAKTRVRIDTLPRRSMLGRTGFDLPAVLRLKATVEQALGPGGISR
jgi:hypothetical protein